MSKPLDELYFVWLYSQVGNPETTHPNRTHWRLFRELFSKEFVWFVPNDDNRFEDSKELRYEFIEQEGVVNVDVGWVRLGCSMLELLIGLSRRLSFVAEGEPRDWFWELMDNLGLSGSTDAHPYSSDRISEILDRVIWRTYQPDGQGGLFPLNQTGLDQRKIELWYQLNQYVLERT